MIVVNDEQVNPMIATSGDYDEVDTTFKEAIDNWDGETSLCGYNAFFYD